MPGAIWSIARNADARHRARARSSCERIEGQLLAEHVGQRAQDRPVLARVARREAGARRHLHPALGVDVDAGLLGVGGARQDHVGAVRAGVAMRADIDDEGARRARSIGDLVGAEQEQHVDLLRRRRRDHADHVVAAVARHEAEVEPADARRRGVQHGEAVPALVALAAGRELRRERQDRGAVRPRQRPLADDDQRPLGGGERLGEVALAGCELAPATPGRRRDSRSG